MLILFADDSASIGRMVTTFLTAHGHQVIHARNGREAVALFQSELPDLVLMDVVMLEMDGIEATRHIKSLASRRWIPLIMMTSLSSKEELIAGIQAGADDYLIKPISLEVLEARIQSMDRIAQIQDSLFNILDNVYEGVITIDGHGGIRAFNKAAERIFGYGFEEVAGRNVNMLMPPPYAEEHDGYLGRYLAGGAPRIIGIGRKVSGLRKNGEVFPLNLAVTEVRSSNGSLFIGLVRDISVEEEARQRIEHMALHDPLTGLPNRARFKEVLEEASKRADARPCAVLFIDLDGFKPINDEHGHEAGDQALSTVAKRLLHGVAEKDVVARLGGDEFVVLLVDVGDKDVARNIAERLLSSISQPMNLMGHPCRLGASIGVGMMPADGVTANDILTLADNAMYVAKRSGKGCVVLTGEMPRVYSG
jgi:diguanylate cyclase (GGDEF)-like protein/PAS domain S-box-containing protein